MHAGRCLTCPRVAFFPIRNKSGTDTKNVEWGSTRTHTLWEKKGTRKKEWSYQLPSVWLRDGLLHMRFSFPVTNPVKFQSRRRKIYLQTSQQDTYVGTRESTLLTTRSYHHHTKLAARGSNMYLQTIESTLLTTRSHHHHTKLAARGSSM